MFSCFLKNLSGASSVDGSSLRELLVSLGLLASTSAPLQGYIRTKDRNNSLPIWRISSPTNHCGSHSIPVEQGSLSGSRRQVSSIA
jgi:hypothetical protein